MKPAEPVTNIFIGLETPASRARSDETGASLAQVGARATHISVFHSFQKDVPDSKARSFSRGGGGAGRGRHLSRARIPTATFSQGMRPRAARDTSQLLTVDAEHATRSRRTGHQPPCHSILQRVAPERVGQNANLSRRTCAMLLNNNHYGHRNILNEYAGVSRGTQIPGHLQHGWNYDFGMNVVGVKYALPNPFFLWSARNLRHCRKAGLGDIVMPVGAPFLYMPPAENIDPIAKSLLVMPFHGWEKERVEQDFQEYAQAIRDIAKDFSKVTVCLYWYDMQFPQYRRPFEELGAEVVTAGHRNQNPQFLFDLRKLMLRAEYVTANRVQTAAFYAMMLGRKFFVYGPPTGLDGSVDRSGELFHAWQKQEFPFLFWENFNDKCYDSIAKEELGFEFQLTPQALRDLFAWNPEQRSELQRRIDAYHKRRANEARIAKREKWVRWATQISPEFLKPYLNRIGVST